MREFERGIKVARPTSRKSDEDFIRMQGRGFVGLLIDVTPPSKGLGRSRLQNRQAGDKTIEVDAWRVGRPVRSRQRAEIVTEGEFFAEWESRRSRHNGRVRKGGEKMTVYSPVFHAEIRTKKAKVGRLAAGWLPGAREVKAPVPAWIARHPGKEGLARSYSTVGKVGFYLENAVWYGDRVTGFRRRVQFALDVQGRRMARAAASYWEERLRKAGFLT
jgi:hypothetical protein